MNVWTVVLCAMMFVAETALADDGVSVRKMPASAVVRMFDSRHPPREMPKLVADEAAVTESGFECAVQMEVETQVREGEAPMSKIVSVSVTLKLEVTEWLPRDGPAKVRAHEDGHRAISELYYENVDQVAKQTAKQYIGKELKPKSADPADVQETITKAANDFCQEYQGAIQKPSQKAQELYDQITDHGRNKVLEKQAVKRAIEQAGKLPATTQPTK